MYGVILQFVNTNSFVLAFGGKLWLASPLEMNTSVSANPPFLSVMKKWVVSGGSPDCVQGVSSSTGVSGGGVPLRVTVPLMLVS
jgi:hypothetical protein